MKFVRVWLFFILAAGPAFAGEYSESLLFIQPEFGYQATRIFTNSQSAGYTGLALGGSVYYKIGDEDFAFAPFVSYTIGSYNSGANNAVQTETQKERTVGAGLKLYFGKLFLRANYVWMSVKNESQGLVTQTISDSSTGLGGGIGIVFPVSSYVKFEVSGDVQNVSFKANPSGFTSASQVLRFGGTFGISVLLPSSAPKRTYQLKTSSPRD